MQQMIIVTAVSSRAVWILALRAAAAASAFALFRISYVLFLSFCNRGS
jgi:hypothetical protein